MKLVYLLHVYQPPYQAAGVLRRVVDECYRELFRSLAEASAGKILVNIPASLTWQLHEQGFDDVLSWLRRAVRRGRVELTASAAYHPILPLLPADHVVRQIRLNQRINGEILGAEYQPSGFFCPELSLDARTAALVRREGFRWMLADEISWDGTLDSYPRDRLVRFAGITVLLRNRHLSNALAHSVWRRREIHRGDELAAAADEELAGGPGLLALATDGEVFGHHQPGRHELLREILRQPGIDLVGAEELFGSLPEVPHELEPCSWSSQPFELAGGVPYSLWRDPENELHDLQWRLLELAISTAELLPRDEPGALDRCLASDQFFWAGCRPWWDPGMIEQGARAVFEAINEVAPETVECGVARATLEGLLERATTWQAGGEAGRRVRSFAAASGLDLERLGDALQ